jgi:hypothetical protein
MGESGNGRRSGPQDRGGLTFHTPSKPPAGSSLPLLLKGIFSPSIDDFETDARSLLHDILGMSRKPELGPLPAAVADVPDTGCSPAATAIAIAKLFVEITTDACPMQPMLSVHSLVDMTELSEDDVIDGLLESQARGMGYFETLAAVSASAAQDNFMRAIASSEANWRRKGFIIFKDHLPSCFLSSTYTSPSGWRPPGAAPGSHGDHCGFPVRGSSDLDRYEEACMIAKPENSPGRGA